MKCDILHVKSMGITYNVNQTTNESNVVITLPNATLVNGQVFSLSICQQLPTVAPGTNPQVYLSINGTAYPLYLKMGNYVRINSLRCRKQLLMVYGSDPDHITVLSPCLRF